MGEKIKKFDKNGNKIYCKEVSGFEFWQEFDENNRKIHWKDSAGSESWYKYNKNNIRLKITEQEYRNIEFRKQEKEYLSRRKVSRFEIMDI